jgi:hypothetical protein
MIGETAGVSENADYKGKDLPPLFYCGGSTIILDPLGEVRYVILKSVVGANRLERRRKFLQSEAGKQFWQRADDSYKPKKGLFRLLHGGDKSSEARGSFTNR